MNDKQNEWEKAYQAKNNFLFYPHEEVVRFVSKYIRKRVGMDAFVAIYNLRETPRFLDLGCGIGRHVIYAYEQGLDAYGIDLSATAVTFAQNWALIKGIQNSESHIKQGDIRFLPWEDEYFDVIVSHGVLDSVSFDIAQETVREVHRALTKGGFFYCDLISGDDSKHFREYAGEEIVSGSHENGTIQSYFNYSKICKLLKTLFDIVEICLDKRENILAHEYSARYHLILSKR